ncbi:MarR family winged helix-turn-helix transcriptional regulator [Nocardioides insulae]|uniref:MarR family winged helix-turn-helix transcriptional regulator n=1 Tax=Nocardioides insulae TaxID=394734 RepID=UPI0004255636|nr:MarR family transcriptional regulator [Nocardioides insulae]
MKSRPDSLRQLENEFNILWRRVKRVSAERARMVHPELSGPTYSMLNWLVTEGAARASRLVEIFEIDKAAVSRHLHHLEALGLVDRTPDPDDGRATLIVPTEEAIRRIVEVHEARRQVLEERLMDWSPEDLARFADDLARYNKTLD